MRGLADENLSGITVELLRNAGHDIIWAREEMLSASDAAVLARAMLENRVVITYDKQDYGRLIYQDGHPAQCGVVLFRFRRMPPQARSQFIVDTLSNDSLDWRGKFTVIRTGLVPGM